MLWRIGTFGAAISGGLIAFALSSCSKTSELRAEHVQVAVEAPTVEVRYVDKMYYPQGTGCGRAYTFWSFICRTNFELKYRNDLAADGRRHYKIKSVKMTLSLPITESLPFGVSQKLRDHEQGHIKICQRAYLNAGSIALQCAQTFVDTDVSVPADGRMKTSADVADRKAHLAVCQAYREQTADIADGASLTYDKVTDHGMNEVPEEQAIKQAFDQYSKRQAKSALDEKGKSK